MNDHARRPARRSPARRPTRAPDPWLAPPPLPDVEPIPSPAHVTSLLQSLGAPPVAGGDALVNYVAAVVERAASVATALALSVELPAAPVEQDRSDADG